ncbi:hypothetical protein G6F56_005898 [Rhizopus delemar]|nr:hypothetical protein G6F56_005898 [Rhizopus delemar]
MRFKATVNNPTGLFKIAQTLDKIGPTVIMTLSRDSVSFIQHREYETGIQAWMKMQPHSLFTNYRLEGTRTGEINLCFRVNALLSISRNAQRATDIQVKLLIKDG